MELLKEKVKVPVTFTGLGLEKILKKTDLKKCNFLHYRNWVICVNMIFRTVRAKTLLNIKIKDIDLENEDCLIGSLKNQKQQYIPVAKKLKPVMAEYLNYRKGVPNDYVFCHDDVQN